VEYCPADFARARSLAITLISNTPYVPLSRGILFVPTLVLLALAPAAAAHPLFWSPSQWFDTGGRPTTVAIGDLNGDGKADVAAANSGTVTVLFGNGDGTFGNRTNIGTGISPQSVVIADFNEDGLPDLAVRNASNSISVLLGDGAGGSGNRADIEIGPVPGHLQVADLDGDGHLDLATAGSILLGNGDGTLQPEINFDPGASPKSVAIGDFNGDGRLDLVTSCGDNEPETQEYTRAVYVRMGNGDGTFGAATGFGSGYRPFRVATADFNLDGRLDLAFASFGHTPDHLGSVTVLMGNGDGTFGAQYSYGTGTGPIGMAIADFNRDGLPDVVTADGGDDPDWDFLANTVSVFLGNGNGTLRNAPKLYVAEEPSFVAVGDLDGNGTPDLVTPSWYYSLVSVFLGNGNGTFGARNYGVAGYPQSLAIGDLNADGHPDLATTNYGPYPNPVGTISLLFGTANGTFDVRAINIGSPRDVLRIVDLNADGRPDLAMTAYGGYNGASVVSVMLGNGNGTFAAMANFASGSSSHDLAIADLNGDGRPDAVTVNTYPSTVAVLLGNGDGTFGARTEYSTGTYPASVAIGDLNEDGRPDILTEGTYYPRTYSVHLGNGDGTFAPRTDLVAEILESNSRSVALADLNGDGRLDLVAGGFVKLGNGDGRFGPRTNHCTWGNPAAVKIEDFDGDGRLDVAVAHDREAGEVSVLLGNGDGTFELEARYGVGQGFGSLALADLNSDGRPDLAVANLNSKTVSVLLNHGGRVRPTERRYPAAPLGGVDGVLRVSEPLPIDAAATATNRPLRMALAIRGLWPTATRGQIPIEFALGDGSAARLELLDVAGRALASQQVGTFGPGRHALDLSPGRALTPGIYFLRLTQAGREARARVAVLR
jgi:hypothetical protein